MRGTSLGLLVAGAVMQTMAHAGLARSAPGITKRGVVDLSVPLIPRRREGAGTKEAVTARLAAAEAKRQRRRGRNLRTVAAGGIQAA